MGAPCPELGLIEGYYGRPWTWAERAESAAALAREGYRFHIYAPKADPWLRRRWREPYPDAEAGAMAEFAAACRRLGVAFGVGLSPFEIYRDFGADAQRDLAAKLAQLDAIGVDILCILFDDMRGDVPGLAQSQVRILDWVAARTGAARMIFCPTYYSDDPALDSVFGVRPPDYLPEIGRTLDPRIEVFWTGEEVCARAFGAGHLSRVAETLRRRPTLWDNYPVNDGPRMSRFLHLRAFTGRGGPGEADLIRAHAVNPALQPTLSRIPLASLPAAYAEAQAYAYGAAFAAAARAVLGAELAELARRHVTLLQDTGLDRIEPATRERLKGRYAAFDHPGAREIVRFLDGDYLVTAADFDGA